MNAQLRAISVVGWIGWCMGWFRSLLDRHENLVNFCECWVAVAKWILYLLIQLSIFIETLKIGLLLLFFGWIRARSWMDSTVVLLLFMRKVFIIYNKVFWKLELCNDIFAELINREFFCDFNDATYSPSLASLMICLRPCLHLLSRVSIIRGAWSQTWDIKWWLKIRQTLLSRRIMLS